MPKVPYSGVSDVELRPLPQNRQSAAGADPVAFGAGYAKGMVALGEGVGDVADTANAIALDIQRREEKREFENAKLAIEASDADSYLQLQTLKGQKAIDGYEGAKQRATQTRAQVLRGMKHQRSREALDTWSNASLLDHKTKVDNYIFQQTYEADKANAEARIAQQVEIVGMATTTTEEVRKAAIEAHDAVSELADLNGITDPEIVEAMQRGARAQLLEARILAFMESGQINPQTGNLMARDLFQNGTKDHDGAQILDPRTRLRLGQALDTLEAAEVKRQETLLKEAKAADELRQADTNKNTESGMMDSLREGTPLYELQRSYPMAWNDLDDASKKRLESADSQRADGKLHVEQSNGQTFDEFMSLPVEQRADQRELNVRAGAMTRAEFNEAEAAHKAAKGDQEALGAGHEALEKMAGKERWAEFGVDQQNRLKASMDARIQRDFTSKGNVPTKKELEGMAVELTLPLSVNPRGPFGIDVIPFGDFMTTYGDITSLTPAQRSNIESVPYDQIPEGMRADAEAKLQDAGIEPTPDMIEELVLAYLRGDRAAVNSILGAE